MSWTYIEYPPGGGEYIPIYYVEVEPDIGYHCDNGSRCCDPRCDNKGNLLGWWDFDDDGPPRQYGYNWSPFWLNTETGQRLCEDCYGGKDDT